MSRTEVDEDGIKYEVFTTEDMFPSLKDPENVDKFNALESKEKEAMNRLFFFVQSKKNKGEMENLDGWGELEQLIEQVADLREKKLKILVGR